MGNASMTTIPDDIFTHIVRREMSIEELMHYIYYNPSPSTIEHFRAINNHLKEQVEPGQLVIISPPNSQVCTKYEAALGDLARKVDRELEKRHKEERVILGKHYDLLINIASYSGIGYGVGMTYFTHHKKHVESILKQIEQLYVETYNKNLNLHTAQFIERRKALFMRLNAALDRMIGAKSLGLDLDTFDIKRSLGLNTKSVIKQWKKQVGPAEGIPEFEKNFSKAAKYTKVLRYGGYVGVGLDVEQSALIIHKACTLGTNQECTKSKFAQGGRLVGSTVGGSLGGMASSYLMCNVIFGLESGGTSLLWCGILAGATGG